VFMADVALDDAPPPVDDTVEGLEQGLISQ
jgi:hypothetical protein